MGGVGGCAAQHTRLTCRSEQGVSCSIAGGCPLTAAAAWRQPRWLSRRRRRCKHALVDTLGGGGKFTCSSPPRWQWPGRTWACLAEGRRRGTRRSHTLRGLRRCSAGRPRRRGSKSRSPRGCGGVRGGRRRRRRVVGGWIEWTAERQVGRQAGAQLGAVQGSEHSPLLALGKAGSVGIGAGGAGDAHGRACSQCRRYRHGTDV